MSDATRARERTRARSTEAGVPSLARLPARRRLAAAHAPERGLGFDEPPCWPPRLEISPLTIRHPAAADPQHL